MRHPDSHGIGLGGCSHDGICRDVICSRCSFDLDVVERVCLLGTMVSLNMKHFAVDGHGKRLTGG